MKQKMSSKKIISKHIFLKNLDKGYDILDIT